MEVVQTANNKENSDYVKVMRELTAYDVPYADDYDYVASCFDLFTQMLRKDMERWETTTKT